MAKKPRELMAIRREIYKLQIEEGRNPRVRAARKELHKIKFKAGDLGQWMREIAREEIAAVEHERRVIKQAEDAVECAEAAFRQGLESSST